MALGVSDHPATLGDRYELTEVIGQGGMAVVWLAYDRTLHRQVAAKVLAGDRHDGVSQRRFFREARHVASLSHPNIVRVFDFGNDGERSFIIMEYVQGVSLRSVLAQDANLSVPETCRLAADTLRALEHAHERGIIHRDVKPGNLLIDVDGTVKVTDFGIARAFDETSELTVGGTFLGTFGYASPEQLGSGPVGAPSDLYSLGCVLFQCLTGHLPYESDDPQRVAAQHQFAEPPSVTALRPGVSPEVAAVIGSALGKSPSDRPTAEAMAMVFEPRAAPNLLARARPPDVDRAADTMAEDQAVEPRDTKRTVRWVLAMGAAIVAVAALLWALAPTAPVSHSSELASGGLLAPGHSIGSPNGRFELIMQQDGNLVSYRTHPKTALWQSGTSGYLGAYLVMQSDGNLVLYPFGQSAPPIGKPSAALWCSGTSEKPRAVAHFRDNGTLVVSSPTVGDLWAAPRDPSACTHFS